MPSISDLNNKLEGLAELDRSLWKAYENSEKEYLPPTINPVRVIPTYWRLVKSRKLAPYYNHLIFAAFAIAFAIGGQTWSAWLIIAYILFLWAAVRAKAKYIDAFVEEKLGHSNISRYAFGITTPALLISGVLKLKEAGGATLNGPTAASLAKLVKAGQDYTEISFGLMDALRKALFGVPVATAIWIQSNPEKWNDIQHFVNLLYKQGPLVFLIVFSVLFLILLGCCNIIIQPTLKRRKQKKYLLVLNLISESFVTKRT